MKRLLIHSGGFNLGLAMRALMGVGTPRGLQGLLHAYVTWLITLWREWHASTADHEPSTARWVPCHRFDLLPAAARESGCLATGC